MVEQSLDEDYLARWIGNGETIEDVVSASQAEKLAATLDIKDMDLRTGAALPPFWHWIYFSTAAPASDLGPDGHPLTGDFYPPVALPRRMWAGGRLESGKPLAIGDHARRDSRIKGVKVKEGRTGTLCFVVVRHEFYVGDELRVAEEHDIVYRAEADPGTVPPEPPMAPVDADWTQDIVADPVTLFRYSALTFNSHRIHYDRRYCREVENYEGLVVHGPLTTTLLLDFVRKQMPDAEISDFSFRAVSPLFDTGPVTVAGKLGDGQVDLWAANAKGQLAMQATAVLA
ncbi:MAG: acyl-CoA dehydrogenase [Alphaproteobacteria bacterium]|jgi:3-methylfumaryl-CoA hydratase|nr:acyl-CoA dehydrogenase [Alphaproteobacteria bacterium]MBT4019339.1 acyl-CoA dehydrogenase [Alphaproteobacteria bacterium]MBT4966694.1 acyl-CoA dehydrogenase [Alphaproteobacteria bacterium]MBT5161941.1 acyl-CoA dehydrogenase [Alphaproteobacteria bacterium]MBT5920031.1 acyl-CoA dehydrogenase [Alphaproteobacteria bacterium]